MGNIINKLQQIFSFRCGVTPNDIDFKALINSNIGVLTDPLQLPPPSEEVENTVYKIADIFYTCTKQPDDSYTWVQSSATGGVTSYNKLEDKPRINNVILGGNRTPEELGVLRDNGGYTLVRPEPRDIIPLIRSGIPFQSRVSDLISSLNVEEVVILEDITHIPPVISDATVGRTRYFNTQDMLIYVADTIATWNPQGVPAVNGVLYVNRANNSLHWFDGSQMLAISGGGGGGGTATRWLSDEGSPTNTIGNIGDWYINLLNYDIYEKTGATTWTLRGNIKGAKGEKGDKGDAGIIQAGSPFDFLITDNSGTVTWQTGYMEKTIENSNNINISVYSKKFVINYNYSQDNVTITISSNIFPKNMQDCMIVIYNSYGSTINITVNCDIPIEWENNKMIHFTVENNKTKEVSLSPYMINNVLKIRGIVG